ncbi:MAG TPA: S8 family serine peptidase [Anaerolineaceae bacterium]|nr:S8 family serine peptidase [Anaerolineaceae bacterium]
MLRLLLFSILVLTFFTSAAFAPVQARPAEQRPVEPAGGLDVDLRQLLTVSKSEQKIPVIVTLKDQSALNLAPGRALSLDRIERAREVVTSLRARYQISQASLRLRLDQAQKEGKVEKVVSFWIFNGVSLSATPQMIQELASRPDVLSIHEDSQIHAPVLQNSPATSLTVSGQSINMVQPNLLSIRIPDLWARGYRGKGVVVANVDTGVDATHPDLANQYRGGTNSWFDPYHQHATPVDVNGHGTWTMGVMVGRNASGSSIGVAPEAQWIAARIFDDNNIATITAIHQAYQWLLDPDGNPATNDAPDVVNSSWGLRDPGCDLSFEPDLQALRAVGILPIFSAGNSGPGYGTDTSPANNPGAFSVGATDSNGTIYYGSSRGSTACGGEERTYPAVTAPGVSIYSSSPADGYASSTGTSLAAPHVAGMLALLLSARPELSPEEQETMLERGTVDLGNPGPDNDFGFGQIDGPDAFALLGPIDSLSPQIFLPLVTR